MQWIITILLAVTLQLELVAGYFMFFPAHAARSKPLRPVTRRITRAGWGVREWGFEASAVVGSFMLLAVHMLRLAPGQLSTLSVTLLIMGAISALATAIFLAAPLFQSRPVENPLYPLTRRTAFLRYAAIVLLAVAVFVS